MTPEEEALYKTLEEAMGRDVCSGCSLPELIALIISQRDNAYNEANAFKPKTDLARIKLIKKMRDQIVASCKVRVEAIPLTGETNWSRIELVYLHEHMTKEKGTLDNYERILKETENG